MTTKSSQLLGESLADLTPTGWRFAGLYHTGGNCYAYRYEANANPDGEYILVTGDDVLSSDGSVDDFGTSVLVGQYLEDESGDWVTPSGEPTEWAWRFMEWAVSDDLCPFPATLTDIVTAVREVFKRWGVK